MTIEHVLKKMKERYSELRQSHIGEENIITELRRIYHDERVNTVSFDWCVDYVKRETNAEDLH